MTSVGHVCLFVIGLGITFFVLDAAVRTFVVPRGSFVTLTARRVRRRPEILSLFARPVARLRAARPRHGAVRAAGAARAPCDVAAVDLPRVRTASSPAWRSTAGAARSRRAARRCSRSASNGRPTSRRRCSPSPRRRIGLALLALLISYLPTIYNTFSRREIAVTDLSIRAGTPPSPSEWLIRAHRTGFLNDMDRVLGGVDDVVHRGAGRPTRRTARSRSSGRRTRTDPGSRPRAPCSTPRRLRLAVLDLPWTPAAPVCIRSGYIALREVAGFFGFDYDDDPAARRPDQRRSARSSTTCAPSSKRRACRFAPTATRRGATSRAGA